MRTLLQLCHARAIVVVLAATLTGCSRPVAPDLVLLNGAVITGDASRPTAEAVAISGERIVAVGSSAEVSALASSATRRIDVQGRTVVAGLNDAHAHFSIDPQGARLAFEALDPAWDTVRTGIARAAAQESRGTWITASVGPSVVLDPAITRDALDRVAPAHPVILRAYYGHGYVLNSAALRDLVVNDETPDPLGGYFERTKGSRRINGRAWEYAAWNLDRLLGERASDADVIAALQATAREAAGFGITSMQVMSNAVRITRFVELLVNADLPIRVRATPFALTEVGRRHRSETRQAPWLIYPTSQVTVGGVKWVIDGTPYERGAALRHDYADRPGWRGAANFSDAEVEVIVREAAGLDQPLMLHVAGDASAEAVIATLERLAAAGQGPARRVRLEHGDGVVGDLIPRAKALGLIVVQNPSHFTDVPLFHARWGLGMQPLRSLIDGGVHVALGSDGPMNPFLNMMLATVHPSNPAEAITRAQALDAYTRGAAFAEHEENWKGTIAVGRAADLAVLSHDILSVPPPELPKTHSVLTIVAGKVVHDPGGMHTR